MKLALNTDLCNIGIVNFICVVLVTQGIRMYIISYRFADWLAMFCYELFKICHICYDVQNVKKRKKNFTKTYFKYLYVNQISFTRFSFN